MPGTLYLLPNLLGPATSEEEHSLAAVIPERVQELTASLGYLIAENAKSARAYLKLIDRVHPLARALQEIRIAELNVNTKAAALPALLQPLLAGEDAGLISEAGLPAIADPGADLVRLAHQQGIQVKPMSGPSSLIMAVMASGLNGQSFAFNGYLPIDPAQRGRRIKQLEDRSRKEGQTQILIETPYRNDALLEALASHCQSQTLVSIATDLSLSTESIQTQSAGQWQRQIAQGRAPKLHKRPTVFLILA